MKGKEDVLLVAQGWELIGTDSNVFARGDVQMTTDTIEYKRENGRGIVKLVKRLCLILLVVLLAGCATAPSEPTYTTSEIIEIIEQIRKERGDDVSNTTPQDAPAQEIEVYKVQRTYPRIHTEPLIESAEDSVQILRDMQRDLKEQQRKQEEDRYREKQLEYQRRQAEALEKQNQKTYRTIYDY